MSMSDSPLVLGRPLRCCCCCCCGWFRRRSASEKADAALSDEDMMLASMALECLKKKRWKQFVKKDQIHANIS